MKKIAIIGSVGYPSKYGGFETLVHHLVEQLHDQYELTVYSSSKAYSKSERIRYKNNGKAKNVYIPFKANGIQSIIYDSFSIIHSLFFADTILVLGVAGAILFPFVRLFTKKTIIVNIDGLEWKREKWNKFAKWYLKWCEYLAVKWAHQTIADNKVILDYVKEEYKKEGTCIAYGADHCSVQPFSLVKNKQFKDKEYAFKVARIEPENNLDMILEAFKEGTLPLVIVGNWNHSEYSKNLFQKYHDYNNLILLDPIYNQKDLNAVRSNCKVYIHGHSAGGTNPSLVEAMYLQLPIFSFDVNFNRETTENKAMYFANHHELEQLVSTIDSINLNLLANDMKEIAERKYLWKIIAEGYAYWFEARSTKKKRQLTPEMVID